MRKTNLKKLGAALLIGAMAVTSLVGCGSSDSSKNESTTAATTAATTEAATYTVTFMNGDETLGTATATADTVLDASAYSDYENVDGAEFLGWFETPSFAEVSKKDLTTYTFTADTTLYGSFKSTSANEDTRAWYVVGTSESGPLKDSNWAGSDVAEDTRENFRLQATGNATNEFAITIDLYAGDQFQVIHDWSWDGQKGYGCFSDLDETMFSGGEGLGGTAEKSNVNVEMDGNYTITLTTDPDDEVHDTLTITRNGDIE